MPIYDQSYRRYEARAPLHQLRFWPITREALRLVLAKRAFLGLLAVSLLPLIVRLIQIYFVTNSPQIGTVLPIDGRLFGEFLNQQTGFSIPPFPTFTVLLCVFGGAGLIANDLRTGGILVYLSRPLTRRDYVLGKLGVLLVLNLSVTLLPGLLLYAGALGLAPAQFAAWRLAWIGPAIVLHSIVSSAMIGLLALAVSALSRSGRVAGLAFFILVFGSDLVRVILHAGFGRGEAVLLSPLASLRLLGDALFASGGVDTAVRWPWALGVVLLVSLGSLAVLRSRVRAVEIVK
jgi:ABC-2 type transport system permease protein